MQRFIAVFLIIALIAISSCHNPPPGQGSLTLKFNPMFGSDKMILNKTFNAPDGKNYFFTTFKLYLSHIKLVHADGSTVEVKPLAYLSLDDSAAMSISLANTPGSYTGIQFYIGVDSIQDNVDPVSIADTTNPQSPNNNMFWNYTLKYVFVVLEGRADTTSNPSTPILYHVGTPGYYTSVPTLSKSFSVTGTNQTMLTLNADLQKEFYGANSINIATQPVTQTTDNPSVAVAFITDLATVFSLQ